MSRARTQQVAVVSRLPCAGNDLPDGGAGGEGNVWLLQAANDETCRQVA